MTTGDAADTAVNLTTSYDNCDLHGIHITGSSLSVGTNNGGLVNLNITTNDLRFQFSNSDSYVLNLIADYKTSDEYLADVDFSGLIDFSVTEVGVGQMAFDSFHVLLNNSEKLELNGKVSIKAEQETCQNGVYNVQTLDSLTLTSNGYSSGSMLINGTTYVYKNDGTADVTFADGSTTTINQDAELVCN